MKAIRDIRDFQLKNRRVFLRLDFNVPLKDGHIEDPTRILEAIPTIQYAVAQEAKVILASHLGRPDGKKDPKYSLEPICSFLAEKLNSEITLTEDLVGEGIRLMTQRMKPGQLLMLENLRFDPREEKNDPRFCHALSELCEVYINDAFGAAHRKHASIFGLPSRMQERGMGFLIEKELRYLEKLTDSPARPFFVLLGGSKVSDKIKTIESLLQQVQGVAVGGAMAFAFIAAQDYKLPTGAKVPSSDDVQAAKTILKTAKRREVPLLLPSDFIDAFDIGPKTVAKFCEFLSKAKTVFWNGPLGWFEKPPYEAGTFQIAEALSEMPALKFVGGGDTVSAVQTSGFASGFDHLSTGGGAVLEYLETNSLPGIDVLKPERSYHKHPHEGFGHEET